MSQQRYYRTRVAFDVLSDEEVSTFMSVDDIVRNAGDYVMVETRFHRSPLTAQEMANALTAAGSEPGFFGLDEKGHEVNA